MTIDEAIEVLRGEPGPQFILEGVRAYVACQLGIEALKRLKETRDCDIFGSHNLLPGETKE